MMGTGMTGWGLGGGLIVMVLFWGLLILGIVALVKWIAAQGGSHSAGEESPLDVLARRYARGEITQDDFRRMKRDIVNRR